MWGQSRRGLFSIEHWVLDTNNKTFQMLQINIELTVLNASNTRRRRNGFLILGQRRRQ